MATHMTWQSIPGWFDWPDLYREAVDSAPKNAILVEHGVAFGRSLAFLAEYAIEQKRHDLSIVGIDPWVDDWTAPTGWTEETRPSWGAENAGWAREQGGPFSAFIVSMRTYAPAALERVDVMRALGHEIAATFRPSSVHMAFIDGDHRYEPVLRDIAAWSLVVTPDGILAGHDHTPEFPGVVKAVAEAFPSGVDVRGTSWVRRNE